MTFERGAALSSSRVCAAPCTAAAGFVQGSWDSFHQRALLVLLLHASTAYARADSGLASMLDISRCPRTLRARLSILLVNKFPTERCETLGGAPSRLAVRIQGHNPCLHHADEKDAGAR